MDGELVAAFYLLGAPICARELGVSPALWFAVALYGLQAWDANQLALVVLVVGFVARSSRGWRPPELDLWNKMDAMAWLGPTLGYLLWREQGSPLVQATLIVSLCANTDLGQRYPAHSALLLAACSMLIFGSSPVAKTTLAYSSLVFCVAASGLLLLSETSAGGELEEEEAEPESPSPAARRQLLSDEDADLAAREKTREELIRLHQHPLFQEWMVNNAAERIRVIREQDE